MGFGSIVFWGLCPSDVVFLVWAFKRIRSCYGKNIRTNKKNEGLDEDLPSLVSSRSMYFPNRCGWPKIKWFTNFELFPFLLVVGILPKLMSGPTKLLGLSYLKSYQVLFVSACYLSQQVSMCAESWERSTFLSSFQLQGPG